MSRPLATLLAFILAAPAVAADRPNVVLLIADDMGREECGAFGHPTIRTPNIDRLARDGLRFDRAFLTCSSCSPSRSTMITGRYPHATGAYELHWPLPKEQVTFVEKLKAAGYWTAQAGKWHLGNAVKDRFDQVREVGSAGFQSAPGGAMVDKQDASGCGQWLPTLRGRPKDKPFFLWLASVDPHRDYEEGIIPRPHRPEEVVVPPYLPDVPETRKDLGLYYDEINRLDGYVGKVLEELERQGVADNTVVLFLSDNGRPFPRCKTRLYDSGIRTPLIVRWPGHVKPGGACGSLVSSVDLAPTILELAGVPIPPTVQGKSFAPLLTDPAKKTRDHIFAEHDWHDFTAHERAVRSERFTYVRNYYPDLPATPPADAVRSPTFRAMRKLRDEGKLTEAQRSVFVAPRPAEELYDTEADPHSLHNLAGDPKYAATLAELRAALDRWQRETDDRLPATRSPDEFDRETGKQLPGVKRPRGPR